MLRVFQYGKGLIYRRPLTIIRHVFIVKGTYFYGGLAGLQRRKLGVGSTLLQLRGVFYTTTMVKRVRVTSNQLRVVFRGVARHLFHSLQGQNDLYRYLHAILRVFLHHQRIIYRGEIRSLLHRGQASNSLLWLFLYRYSARKERVRSNFYRYHFGLIYRNGGNVTIYVKGKGSILFRLLWVFYKDNVYRCDSFITTHLSQEGLLPYGFFHCYLFFLPLLYQIKVHYRVSVSDLKRHDFLLRVNFLSTGDYGHSNVQRVYLVDHGYPLAIVAFYVPHCVFPCVFLLGLRMLPPCRCVLHCGVCQRIVPRTGKRSPCGGVQDFRRVFFPSLQLFRYLFVFYWYVFSGGFFF